MVRRRYRRRRRAKATNGGIGRRSARKLAYLSTFRSLAINGPKEFRMLQRNYNSTFMTSSAGGVINLAIHCMDPSHMTDWTALGSLYDLYKVVGVKVQFYPAANAIAEGAGAYRPCYIAYDPDSNTSVGTVDGSLQYSYHRVKNLFKPWKFYVRPGVQYDNSVANAGMAVHFVRGKPWLDISNAANYQKGIISIFADNLPVSYFCGDLVVTYYVKFCIRR